MARRRKGADAGFVLLVTVVVAVLSTLPKEIWIAAGVIFAIVLFMYTTRSMKRESSTNKAPEPSVSITVDSGTQMSE